MTIEHLLVALAWVAAGVFVLSLVCEGGRQDFYRRTGKSLQLDSSLRGATFVLLTLVIWPGLLIAFLAAYLLGGIPLRIGRPWP